MKQEEKVINPAFPSITVDGKTFQEFDGVGQFDSEKTAKVATEYYNGRLFRKVKRFLKIE